MIEDWVRAFNTLGHAEKGTQVQRVSMCLDVAREKAFERSFALNQQVF